jgi:aspartate-semialdehyde dehydrogenase
MSKQWTVAVVGATGMVGQEMLKVLEQRQFPVGKLVPMASERSAGKKLPFAGSDHEVVALSAEAFEGVDIALFSAGGSLSKEWAPVAADKGAIVVDNSSAWRMDPECPLVVPEVNLAAAKHRPKGIIANPNCSTIQMVVALAPIHQAARIQRIIVSTYQAISGAGAEDVRSYEAQAKALAEGKPAPNGSLPGQLAGNLLMNWKPDAETGYQEEELKMVNETRKIFADERMRISPTCVRVPVVVGHSESVTVETEKPLRAGDVRELLGEAPGIELVDDFASGVYPKPLDSAGRDPVYVGRIRNDIGNAGGIQMWVVADNLRKGAALNAVQIAEAVLGTG